MFKPTDPVMLENMLHLAGLHARSMLIESNVELIPSFLVLDAQGTGHVIGTPWHTDEEKKKLVTMVRDFMRTVGARAYSFVCEAWYADVTDWNPETDLRPAERPDRKEGVSALATDGMTALYRMWEIKRGSDGRCTDLIEFERQSEANSWLANLLNPEA